MRRDREYQTDALLTAQVETWSENDCELFEYILWGICGSLVCSFGIVGNALSFAAFIRDRRLPATILVQALAFSDCTLLALVLVTDCVPYICEYTETCNNFWDSWPYIRYIWVFTPISHMCSIWFVVLVALNRFWAVCRAFEAGRVWTNRLTAVYVTIVVFVVTAFNFPRFFEYRIVETTDDYNNTILVEVRTEFGNTTSYTMIYKALLVNVLFILLPICILIILTAAILYKLYVGRHKSKMSSRDVTVVLVVVVIVTIVCQTPLAVFNFVRYTVEYGCGDSIFYLDNVSKFLINVNSCLNFVLYCVFSPKFRKLLLSAVCCCYKKAVSAVHGGKVAMFDENAKVEATVVSGSVPRATPKATTLTSLVKVNGNPNGGLNSSSCKSDGFDDTVDLISIKRNILYDIIS